LPEKTRVSSFRHSDGLRGEVKYQPVCEFTATRRIILYGLSKSALKLISLLYLISIVSEERFDS